jgi:hypothetical protein
MGLDHEPVSLEEVLRRALSDLPSAPNRVPIRLRVEDPGLEVPGDFSYLTRLFLNLLTKKPKATGPSSG